MKVDIIKRSKKGETPTTMGLGLNPSMIGKIRQISNCRTCEGLCASEVHHNYKQRECCDQQNLKTVAYMD